MTMFASPSMLSMYAEYASFCLLVSVSAVSASLRVSKSTVPAGMSAAYFRMK